MAEEEERGSFTGAGETGDEAARRGAFDLHPGEVWCGRHGGNIDVPGRDIKSGTVPLPGEVILDVHLGVGSAEGRHRHQMFDGADKPKAVDAVDDVRACSGIIRHGRPSTPILQVRSGLAQDAGHLGAADRADALGKTSTVCLFDVAGEGALLLAFHAVRLTRV